MKKKKKMGKKKFFSPKFEIRGFIISATICCLLYSGLLHASDWTKQVFDIVNKLMFHDKLTWGHAGMVLYTRVTKKTCVKVCFSQFGRSCA